MAKRKTDKQLRNEISRHSDNVRERFNAAEELQKSTYANKTASEQNEIIHQTAESDRAAIGEAKKVIKLQKTLLNRERKGAKQTKYRTPSKRESRRLKAIFQILLSFPRLSR